ncbi:MBL fold metallo-hydrolase [Caenibius tardaugens]|nr:MBL fold metallo-hydrolase [Caenibius tardaugens]AZI35774.1 MBL fold metallo-hydrolase [Caenibius tardaugens NBRC 16725]
MPCKRTMLMALLAAGAALVPQTPLVAQDAPTAARKSEDGVSERLVLLGTGGGPIVRETRSQPANLLQVGGKTYIIDLGDGTPRQLVRAGVKLNRVDAVFLTHLHFDHTAGTMGFIALDWQDRRKEPVRFYGPPGTQQLVDRTLQALASGEAIFRPQLPDLPAMRTVFSGEDWDVTTPRTVYRDDMVQVLAVENSHYGTMHMTPTDHGMDRSYSYRFNTPTRSNVFTGDTGPSSAVEKLARDADVLVSEIIDIDALIASLRKRQTATGIDQQPLIDHMIDEHLTPENVGRMAANARVRKVVLTHFATPPGTETFDRTAILAAIRKHYAGPVEFGEDLAAY